MINNILHNALIAITNNSDDKFDWNTPLTFTAQEAGSTINLTQTGEPVIASLQYRTSINDEWSTYTITTEITLTNVGDYVQFQNTNNQLSLDSNNYVQFVMTGKIAASGNIQSMLNYSTSCIPYCYYNMFEGCTSLVNVPELPATKLANDCYRYMFYGCTNLTTAPELPATNLARYCYSGMFARCTNLVNAPELPATTLADYCYSGMFSRCTNLVNAPKLPATTLTFRCYEGMFVGCTSLVNAPKLPATTLAYGCYKGMFARCTSLVNAPKLPATTLASNCYEEMFDGCTSLVNVPKLPATTLAYGCYYYMFYGCTSLVNAPELPATNLADYCYRYMFYGCTNLNEIKVYFTAYNDSALYNWVKGVSSTGTFYKPTALPTKFGDNRIPTGWTVETY
jgi:hypothetical protein